jgi:hypothetical protein
MSKNIYHRYLKLPFEHKYPDCFKNKPDKMREENWHEWFVPKEFWDERFVDWLDQHDLKPSNVCEGFYNGPNGGGLPMHNDSPDLDNAVNINFTWGPDNSVTRWWKVKDESLLQVECGNNEYQKECLKGIDVDISVHKFLYAEEKDCDMVYEAVIKQPSLLNVGQLHSTYNPDKKECSWTLSYHILSKKDNRHIMFDEALEIFKYAVYE